MAELMFADDKCIERIVTVPLWHKNGALTKYTVNPQARQPARPPV